MTRPRSAEVLTGEDTAPISWDDAVRRLAEERFYWLATAGPDGRPHVRPVLAVWVDGAVYTSTNPSARKGRNLALDPRCSITARTEDLDIVVEGSADRISDGPALERVAEAYRSEYGWPVTVEDGAFDAPYGAPTAGPPPYVVHGIRPDRIFGFGTDDALGPRTTRWRF